MFFQNRLSGLGFPIMCSVLLLGSGSFFPVLGGNIFSSIFGGKKKSSAEKKSKINPDRRRALARKKSKTSLKKAESPKSKIGSRRNVRIKSKSASKGSGAKGKNALEKKKTTLYQAHKNAWDTFYSPERMPDSKLPAISDCLDNLGQVLNNCIGWCKDSTIYAKPTFTKKDISVLLKNDSAYKRDLAVAGSEFKDAITKYLNGITFYSAKDASHSIEKLISISKKYKNSSGEEEKSLRGHLSRVVDLHKVYSANGATVLVFEKPPCDQIANDCKTLKKLIGPTNSIRLDANIMKIGNKILEKIGIPLIQLRKRTPIESQDMGFYE